MSTSVTRPAFLARFACLGAQCEDTCCKGWDMQMDEPTYARYCSKGPELTNAVAGEEGHRIMRRDAQTDFCVKFEDGLCNIQKQHGTDFLSDACHFYPRMTRALGDRVFMTAALSCPEIARLSLLHDASFETDETSVERLPHRLQDYLPEQLTPAGALEVHQAFVQAALDESRTPARSLMHMVSAAQSLEKISVESWPQAVPFYLENAGGRLGAPQGRETDSFFLLQALCGLVGAAKKTHQPRLMQTINEMEKALHVSIRWDTFAIVPLPDSMHAAKTLHEQWQHQWGSAFAPLLRRYLAAQLSLALFPFAGFGGTMGERIAIIGVRFATVRLALMSVCAQAGGPAAEADVIRVVQSLSRFLDHLADPEFSLKIYRETGWTEERRLRALVGDISSI